MAPNIDISERPVVLAFDGGYVRGAMATLRSLARVRAGQPTVVVALVGDVAPSDRRALTGLAASLGVALTIRDVCGARQDLPFDSHGSAAAYYRLLIGELLPDSATALYVDSDTIFLRDPGELLALEFGPHPIAAVQDLCVPTLGSPDCLPGLEFTAEEGEVPYFNSGLMVIDLERWRHLGLGTAAVRFATESPQHVRFWDQDALNAVVRGDWHRLDRRWNVFPLHDIWKVEEFPYHGRAQVSR